MAKVRGPLFSFGASGTVARAITFNPTEQQTTARSLPRSTAPPSYAQAYHRQRCRDAAAAWGALDAGQKAAWSALVAARALTPFAKFLLEWNAQQCQAGDTPAVPFE